MKSPLPTALRVALFILSAAACGPDNHDEHEHDPNVDTDSEAEVVIVDEVTGDPAIGSIDRMHFLAGGYLAIGDGVNDQLVVVALPEDSPAQPVDVPDVYTLAASAAATAGVLPTDVAVDPVSKRIYFAFETQESSTPVLVKIDDEGALELVDLHDITYAAVSYPRVGDPGSIVSSLISTGSHLVASAHEPSWTASQVVGLPLPLVHGAEASVSSTRTFHTTHGRWETSSPVVSMFPFEMDGEVHVGTSYSCAPVVRFPAADLLVDAAEVEGVTPYDYGGGKMVLDFLTYERDGEGIVLATKQRGGAGSAWDNMTASTVKMSLLMQDRDTNEAAPVVLNSSASPIHVDAGAAPALDRAYRIAKLDEERAVILTDGGLFVVDLP